ncbi:class I SAM-dependent methyltransferase [Bacillus marinisedimentorum]|uniref:class I SAM-dependent methyltransferase n=1 Tax=Bacillus marinisedimentorum TaxID=1821260 RepID=UPI000873063A|nr:class I SAM-dependent methyltransferase [Bacillus marinisedimentorum]
MTEHYYSDQPSVESDPVTWTFTLRGHSLTFTSDQGVFSKKEVDFGSRLLIEAFELPELEGDLLDMGCGYGPIGIALAKDFESRNVVMADINERAVALARKNADANNAGNTEVLKSNLFEEINRQDFAAVLTNPPIRAGKKVVHRIFEEAYSHLAEEGELWVVIQKKQGAPSALEKLGEMFAEVDTIMKKKGYYIIKAKKS